MPIKSAEVEAYLSKLEPDRRAALEQIRSLVLATVPDVVETMRYRMPTFELEGMVCAVASQKHYMSLYVDPALVAKYQEELQGLDCGKSCIRFKSIEKLSLDTVRRILEEAAQSQTGVAPTP